MRHLIDCRRIGFGEREVAGAESRSRWSGVMRPLQLEPEPDSRTSRGVATKQYRARYGQTAQVRSTRRVLVRQSVGAFASGLGDDDDDAADADDVRARPTQSLRDCCATKNDDNVYRSARRSRAHMIRLTCICHGARGP